METIAIKKRNFEIVAPKGERSFITKYKDKLYFVKKFGEDFDGFKVYLRSLKRLDSTGINHTKLFAFDSQTRIVATQYIQGVTALDAMLKGDLPEIYFANIFKAAFFARKEKLYPNYDPVLWTLYKDKLYLLDPVCNQYMEDEQFHFKGIFLWVYSNQFVNYLKEHKLEVDKSRLKTQGEINKEVALKVVKYYI